MIVAIIPARSGSKRIPKKNVRTFCGQPMISWPIEAARAAGVFDRIIVSTDSEEIAAVANHYGAETPFLRPVELSGDHVPTAPVLEHAIGWLTELGQAPEHLCCIYATAPFVRPQYLRQGLETLRSTGCSSCFSVTCFGFPIFRSLKLERDGTLGMFWPEHELTRSQDLPEAYHDAGQFYWLDCRKFLQTGKIYAGGARPVILPRHLVQDIDTPEDWIRAEYMFQAIQNAGGAQ